MMTALEGSPINCAPEMIKGEGYSFPRDWWSVGIMIYQMIGEPFFYYFQTWLIEALFPTVFGISKQISINYCSQQDDIFTRIDQSITWY